MPPVDSGASGSLHHHRLTRRQFFALTLGGLAAAVVVLPRGVNADARESYRLPDGPGSPEHPSLCVCPLCSGAKPARTLPA